MTKKFAQFAMLLAAAFAFTSCADTKESIIDDSLDLMEEMVEALEEGDEDKIKELEEESKELEERAKKVGLDGSKDFEAHATDAQKERMAEIQAKMIKAMMSKAGK